MEPQGAPDPGRSSPAGHPRATAGVRDMGNIGTERREVEFEPLPETAPPPPERRREEELPEPAPASS